MFRSAQTPARSSTWKTIFVTADPRGSGGWLDLNLISPTGGHQVQRQFSAAVIQYTPVGILAVCDRFQTQDPSVKAKHAFHVLDEKDRSMQRNRALWVLRAGLKSKEPVPAVDEEVLTGVIAAGITHNVYGKAREIFGDAPSAHGYAFQHVIDEAIIIEGAFCHRGIDPPWHNGVSSYAPAGIANS